MHQLVGKLSAVDPVAGEGLKVIEYFDALIGAEAGLAAIARAAAVLSGTVAGVASGARTLRYEPSGEVARPESHGQRLERQHDAVVAWIERDGEWLANDEIIVERMLLAASLSASRHRPAVASASVDLLTHADVELEQRGIAAAALRLGDRRVSAIASLMSAPDPGIGPSSPVPTRFGVVRASLTAAPPTAAPQRLGIGVPCTWQELPHSWRSAVIALRMTDEEHPVARAEDLGVLLQTALHVDDEAPHPDVQRLRELQSHPSLLATLDALVETGSARAAAARLGIHHSTLAARLPHVLDQLGFDPRTPLGRARYAAARQLLIIAESRLD